MVLLTSRITSLALCLSCKWNILKYSPVVHKWKLKVTVQLLVESVPKEILWKQYDLESVNTNIKVNVGNKIRDF